MEDNHVIMTCKGSRVCRRPQGPDGSFGILINFTIGLEAYRLHITKLFLTYLLCRLRNALCDSLDVVLLCRGFIPATQRKKERVLQGGNPIGLLEQHLHSMDLAFSTDNQVVEYLHARRQKSSTTPKPSAEATFCRHFYLEIMEIKEIESTSMR